MPITHKFTTQAALTGSVGASSTTTAAVDSTGATMLLAIVGGQTGDDGTSFSDSKGNTWTYVAGGFGSTFISFYYCISPTGTGSGHTFTYSKSNTYPDVTVLGFDDAAVYDKTTTGTSISSTARTIPSLTPAESGELLVGAVSLYASSAPSFSVDASYNLIASYNASNYANTVVYKIKTDSSAEAPTITGTQWAGDAGMGHIAFKFGVLDPPSTGSKGALLAFF